MKNFAQQTVLARLRPICDESIALPPIAESASSTNRCSFAAGRPVECAARSGEQHHQQHNGNAQSRLIQRHSVLKYPENFSQKLLFGCCLRRCCRCNCSNNCVSGLGCNVAASDCKTVGTMPMLRATALHLGQCCKCASSFRRRRCSAHPNIVVPANCRIVGNHSYIMCGFHCRYPPVFLDDTPGILRQFPVT